MRNLFIRNLLLQGFWFSSLVTLFSVRHSPEGVTSQHRKSGITGLLQGISTPTYDCLFPSFEGIIGSFRFEYDQDYKILPLEICNYNLAVVLSLAQHISKTTVEPKRRRLQDFAVRNQATTINSLLSSLWHNTPLKQQLSQSEDDYKILPLQICNYKLVVLLSLAQHGSKTTVEPKRRRLRDFAVRNLQL